VIPADFDYLRPATIAEALEMASRDEDSTFLAGGHALVPDWKLKATGPSTVIDLGRIAELRGIEVFSDGDAQETGGNGSPGEVVRIGAMTTSAEIEHSAAIARTAPLLPLAAAATANGRYPPVTSSPLIRRLLTRPPRCGGVNC
jgi:carbon-monoxide dehydrogenase medium subunit